MAILFKANGTQEIVNPKDGNTFTLEELQGYVNGYIEKVSIRNKLHSADYWWWVNEEGRINGSALNNLVSLISGDTIMGDCLLVSQEETE